MSEIIWNDKAKVRQFHATKRFIDDLITLNIQWLYSMGVFNDVYKDIYIYELQKSWTL